MANKRLNATITIGGAITGTLKSALGTVKDKLQDIGGTIRDLERKQRLLGDGIQTFGRMGKDVDGLRSRYAAVGSEIDKLRDKQKKLRQEAELGSALKDARSRLGTAGAIMGGAALGAGMLLKQPLEAYKDQDAAINNMQVAMMGEGGGLPAEFERIKKQTIELGNLLPGTTADFVNLAAALKEQGMPINTIANGALKSAAHLSVILKMVPEQAGEMVAKLRESFQLSEHEFDKMADMTQRARFGFGLKPDDLLLGAKYYGGKLNSLGITGGENVRKVYALQGMAAQQGMDGSTFGTNFSMMLTRVGLMTERLHKNSKEMKAVNAELQKAGIHMEFFDKSGKFAGVDNMVAQLDKLGVMSQEKRLQVLTRIFGEEGGRVADLISRNGVAGFQKALQTIDKEAPMEKRINKALESFANKVEALQGTFTNLLAAIGEPIGTMFAPVMDQLNQIIGGPMQTWIEEHKTIVGLVGGLVAGGAGLLAVGAAVAAIGVASTFAVGGLMSMGGALSYVGGVLAFVGRLLLLNPIGLTITAIAVGALLIYKYWEPISGFFKGLWDGITDTFKQALDSIGKRIDWVGDKWRKFKSWLGFGADDAPSQPGSPSVSQNLPVPGLPTTGRVGAQYTDNSTTTIQVTQQPGQDSKALADEIARRLQNQQRTRSRSIMFDPVTP